MSKIDIDKFVASFMKYPVYGASDVLEEIRESFQLSLKKQGLEFRDENIAPISTNEVKDSEDEKIRKQLVEFLCDLSKLGKNTNFDRWYKSDCANWISWLEKQGKNNMGISEATKQKLEDNLNKALKKETPESWNEFLEKQGEQKSMEEHDFIKIAPGSYALSFINYLDAHLYKGKMCVSNGECEDIESAFQNADWGKIGRYYNKFTQKPVEWSEEDEVMLDEIIDFFENGTVKLQHDLSLYASWLKSLRPQSKWKPTEEQVMALEFVTDLMNTYNIKETATAGLIILDLIKQLKALV